MITVTDIDTLKVIYLLGFGNYTPNYGKKVKVLQDSLFVTVLQGTSGDLDSQIFIDKNTLNLNFFPSKISLPSNSIEEGRYMKYYNGEVVLLPLESKGVNDSYLLPYMYDVNYCYIDDSGNVFINNIEPELATDIDYGCGIYLDFQNGLNDLFGNAWKYSSIIGIPLNITNGMLNLTSSMSISIRQPSDDNIKEALSLCLSTPWRLILNFTINSSSGSLTNLFSMKDNQTNFGPLCLEYDSTNLYLKSSASNSMWDVTEDLGIYSVGSPNQLIVYYDGTNIVAQLNNNTQGLNLYVFNNYLLDSVLCGDNPIDISISKITFTPYIQNDFSVRDCKSFASCLTLDASITDLYGLPWYSAGIMNFTSDGIEISNSSFVYTTCYPLVQNYPKWTLEITVNASSYGKILSYGSFHSITVSIYSDKIRINNITGLYNFSLNTSYSLIVNYASNVSIYVNGILIQVQQEVSNIIADPVFKLGGFDFTGYVKNLRFTPYIINSVPPIYEMNCYKDVFSKSTNQWKRIGNQKLDSNNIYYLGSYSNDMIVQYLNLNVESNTNYLLPNKKYSFSKDVVKYDASGSLLMFENATSYKKYSYPSIKFVSVGIFTIIVDMSNVVYVVGNLMTTYIGSDITWVEVGSLNENSQAMDYGSGYIIDNGDLYSIGSNAYGQLGLGNTTDANVFTKVTPVSVSDNAWKKIYTTGAHTFAIVGDSKCLYFSGLDIVPNSTTFNKCYFSNGDEVSNVEKVLFTLKNGIINIFILVADKVYTASSDFQGFCQLNINNVIDISNGGSESIFAIDTWNTIYMLNSDVKKVYIGFQPAIAKKMFGSNVNNNWIILSMFDNSCYSMIDDTVFKKFQLNNVIDAKACRYLDSNSNIYDYYYVLTSDNRTYFCGTINGVTSNLSELSI